MHDTETRNHRHRSMYVLCRSVARFLEIGQPFHGDCYRVATSTLTICTDAEYSDRPPGLFTETETTAEGFANRAGRH